MRTSVHQIIRRGLEHWQALATRDRRALALLAILLAVAMLAFGIAQPAWQRLQAATLAVHQQQALAARLARQAPSSSLRPPPASASELDEQAKAFGLTVERLQVEGAVLRLVANGEPPVIAAWLQHLQLLQAALTELRLEPREQRIHLQMTLDYQ